MKFLKRTWCEIDLNTLEYNIHLIRCTAQKDVMAIVKANAYGHGDKQVALTCQQCGIRRFGVSNLNEALMLRRFGITGEILILGYTAPEYADLLVKHRITQALISLEYGQALSAAANRPVKVHLKLDTGMSRVGFFAQDGVPIDELKATAALPNLEIEGVFSHFACSDSFVEADVRYANWQIKNFDRALNELQEAGISPSVIHIQNSAGILNYSHPQSNCVRAGIILYGLHPSEDIPPVGTELKPILTMKTIVEQVKAIPAGTQISYGCTFTTDTDRTVATLAVGYADGYFRLLSNRADVLIHGKRCRVLGRVCMDQMIVDVTGVRVQMGDEAVLIGRDGGEEIRVEELAGHIGTINYELVCDISRRVPRVYSKNGAIVDVVDDSLHLQ